MTENTTANIAQEAKPPEAPISGPVEMKEGEEVNIAEKTDLIRDKVFRLGVLSQHPETFEKVMTPDQVKAAQIITLRRIEELIGDVVIKHDKEEYLKALKESPELGDISKETRKKIQDVMSSAAEKYNDEFGLTEELLK